MQMSLKQICPVINGQLFGDDVAFDFVSTDTRSLQQGQLFIALQGPNFDGHDFSVAAQFETFASFDSIDDASCFPVESSDCQCLHVRQDTPDTNR